MGRLIDADVFKESLIHCDGLGRRGLEAVLKTLNEQPTAYDVEKVVAELEAASDVDDIDDVVCIRENKAIDIVRKGGVE